jgi:hypothetical protein
MMKFTSYLAEAKNVHMEHVEEMIFNEGVAGTRKAINFLRDIRDTLSGNAKSKSNFTVKWDGAPAIFAGIDPRDGKFFVAKKGVFNKDPKVYKTQADIIKDTSGDLAEKLKVCLVELKKVGIKNIIQGDLMFTKGDLKSQDIDGNKYITFQPNKIVYAVPAGDPLAKTLIRANMGIVWHTSYSGSTLEDQKPTFGLDIASKLKQVPTIWMDDANYKDVSGTATFTEKETEQITSILSQVGTIFQRMKPGTLNAIAGDDNMKMRFKAFNNMKIRGQGINFRRVIPDLTSYLNDVFDKEAAKVKTDASKQKVEQKRKTFLTFVRRNQNDIKNIYTMIQLLTEAKLMVINKLNQGSSLRTFLRTANGFQVTDQEGFVAIDRLGNGAVKLVNRMEFSRANFSPEFLAGWQ